MSAAPLRRSPMLVSFSPRLPPPHPLHPPTSALSPHPLNISPSLSNLFVLFSVLEKERCLIQKGESSLAAPYRPLVADCGTSPPSSGQPWELLILHQPVLLYHICDVASERLFASTVMLAEWICFFSCTARAPDACRGTEPQKASLKTSSTRLSISFFLFVCHH